MAICIIYRPCRHDKSFRLFAPLFSLLLHMMVVDPSHIQHLHQMIFQDFHRLEIAKSDYLLLSALLERFFQ